MEEKKFSKNHEWIQMNNGETATVGITKHATEMLGDIVFVEVPEKGKNVEYQYNLLDRYQNNTISMARTTGYTCTAVANLVLDSQYKKVGVSPPEFLGEHFEYINNYLKERNVIYNVNKNK